MITGLTAKKLTHQKSLKRGAVGKIKRTESNNNKSTAKDDSEKTKRHVSQLQDYRQNERRKLTFLFDEKKGKPVFQVFDEETGKVIREISSEEFSPSAQIIQNYSKGLFIQTKV